MRSVDRPLAAAALLVASLASAAPALAANTELSNAEMQRVEFGGMYIRGVQAFAQGSGRPYNGGSGGMRVAFAMLPRKWVGYEADIRMFFGGIDTFRPDMGLDLLAIFAPFRWRGRAPGSVTFGIGGGVELFDRPWWPGSGDAFLLAMTRLLLKPTRRTRIQAQYTFTPLSTSYGVSSHVHEVDVSFGKDVIHFGLRGRLDDITTGYLDKTYRAFWIGPVFAMVLK
jgi:hypothetical protein